MQRGEEMFAKQHVSKRKRRASGAVKITALGRSGKKKEEAGKMVERVSIEGRT